MAHFAHHRQPRRRTGVRCAWPVLGRSQHAVRIVDTPKALSFITLHCSGQRVWLLFNTTVIIRWRSSCITCRSASHSFFAFEFLMHKMFKYTETGANEKWADWIWEYFRILCCRSTTIFIIYFIYFVIPIFYKIIPTRNTWKMTVSMPCNSQ